MITESTERVNFLAHVATHIIRANPGQESAIANVYGQDVKTAMLDTMTHGELKNAGIIGMMESDPMEILLRKQAKAREARRLNQLTA